MDVFGKNPANEVGAYFRRSVWGWRPLWEFCVDNYNDLVANVSGHYNDGDGLDETGAKELAKRIKDDLATGKASEYIEQRNAYLASLPLENCDLCAGTGIRSDEVGVQNQMPEHKLSPEQAIMLGRETGWCNGCNGEGKKESWDTNYSLELDDLKEFAEFLENSGGFSIC